VELPDAVELVVVGRLSLRLCPLGPARPAYWPDGKGPEFVESEAAVRALAENLLDAVRLLVSAGIVGLLPGLGPLEGDVVLGQEPPQPLPADADAARPVVGQVVGQLADAPASEGSAQGLGAGLGRLDDELLVVNRYPAGTATRPLGAQRRHPHLVEAVDHPPHAVRGGLHQPGDRFHAVAPR
jgi:hypothetical protein